MKKTFFTKQGTETRDLTDSEIKLFADNGDDEAKKEILKVDKFKATSIEERISAIEKYLGV